MLVDLHELEQGALETYAQDLHRREIQLMRDRIHKKPVGGGPTLGNAPGRRAAGAGGACHARRRCKRRRRLERRLDLF